MKALEILKAMQECGVAVGDTDEAIAELEALKYNHEAQEIVIQDMKKQLEALQAPKTCDGCKFLVHFGAKKSNRVICSYPFACIRRFNNADYYESKEIS